MRNDAPLICGKFQPYRNEKLFDFPEKMNDTSKNKITRAVAHW